MTKTRAPPRTLHRRSLRSRAYLPAWAVRCLLLLQLRLWHRHSKSEPCHERMLRS